MLNSRSALSLLAMASATLSCLVRIDTGDSQCSVDADCVALGEAFAASVCNVNVCVARGAPPGGPIKSKDGELIELKVPTGFVGFLQVTNPDAVSANPNVVLSKKGWFSYAEVSP